MAQTAGNFSTLHLKNKKGIFIFIFLKLLCSCYTKELRPSPVSIESVLSGLTLLQKPCFSAYLYFILGNLFYFLFGYSLYFLYIQTRTGVNSFSFFCIYKLGWGQDVGVAYRTIGFFVFFPTIYIKFYFQFCFSFFNIVYNILVVNKNINICEKIK